MSECYYDAAGCLVCPEQVATPGVPAHVVTQPVIGWTAGANSIEVHDGDLHVVFDQPLNVVGVVLGLKGDRARVTVPSLIEHGWYFQHRGGLNLAQPIERGKVVGTVISNRQASDTFEIRRIGAQVSYLRNGAIVLVSPTRSAGPKLVNTCLYVSGDQVATGVAPSDGGTGGGPDTGAFPHALLSGVGDTVAAFGQALYSDSDGFDPNSYWTIEVPPGATNLAVVLSGSTEALALADATDPYFYAITAPSAVPPVKDDWLQANVDGHYLSGPSDPPPGGTPWRLDIANPAAGTWYIAADTAMTDQVTLTATVS